MIAQVKRSVGIPVIGNGDITSGADARRMISQTGCDLVMVGRGALGNPWLFAEINAALNPEGGDPIPVPAISWEEKSHVIAEHMDLMIADKGEHRAVLEMRKHLGWYIKGIEGAAALRREIMTAGTREQVVELLSQLRPA